MLRLRYFSLRDPKFCRKCRSIFWGRHFGPGHASLTTFAQLFGSFKTFYTLMLRLRYFSLWDPKFCRNFCWISMRMSQLQNIYQSYIFEVWRFDDQVTVLFAVGPTFLPKLRHCILEGVPAAKYIPTSGKMLR